MRSLRVDNFPNDFAGSLSFPRISAYKWRLGGLRHTSDEIRYKSGGGALMKDPQLGYKIKAESKETER
jgi:hypothetical protein